MADGTTIEWTDGTFNPWWGCTNISPGCDRCYAEIIAARFAPGMWGAGAPRREFGDAHWNKPREWNARATKSGKRMRVFCASMADVFDKDAPEGARERLWALIEATPMLDWQLLTKRVGNVREMVPERWIAEGFPPHVWLGITVVNQEEADRDIVKLLALPARVRWLSCEPLLGPIDLKRWLAIDWQCGYCREYFTGRHRQLCTSCGGEGGWCGSHAFNGRHYPRGPISPSQRGSGLDWIVAGGESGRHARPMHPDWARQVRDQCVAAGTAYLFKQWGAWAPSELCDPDVHRAVVTNDGELLEGEHMLDRRDDASAEIIGRAGKREAGRVLDGREWNEYPA